MEFPLEVQMSLASIFAAITPIPQIVIGNVFTDTVLVTRASYLSVSSRVDSVMLEDFLGDILFTFSIFFFSEFILFCPFSPSRSFLGWYVCSIHGAITWHSNE